MVSGHGAAALGRWRHHPADVETLTVTVVWRIIEHALHEEIAVLDELAHLGFRIAFGKDDDVDRLRDVLVANPSIIHGQVQLVVVADEIIVGADGEAHPFLEFAFPCLVTQ